MTRKLNNPPALSTILLAVLTVCCGNGLSQDTRGEYEDARKRMVEQQIAVRGINNQRVLEAMREIPRHLFVPPAWAAQAYSDRPLPIGHQQTISQPYIVALMTSLAEPQPDERVLEVGTGSGYQAAVIAQLVDSVYSIEIIPELAQSARRLLERLGYENVHVRAGDGYQGWPEKAPFDIILITAAVPSIPEPLKEQLAEGGRLVLPEGDPGLYQILKVYQREGDELTEQSISQVRFVPMTGEAQEKP